MKKREFIFAICFICILGMLVTVQVRRLVSGSAQRADVQEYAATEEHKLQKENQTGSATSPVSSRNTLRAQQAGERKLRTEVLRLYQRQRRTRRQFSTHLQRRLFPFRRLLQERAAQLKTVWKTVKA